MYKNKRTLKKVSGRIKRAYGKGKIKAQKLKAEYQTFQKKPAIGRKIKDLKKCPKVRKLKKYKKRLGKNISNYFEESNKQLRNIKINTKKIKF